MKIKNDFKYRVKISKKDIEEKINKITGYSKKNMVKWLEMFLNYDMCVKNNNDYWNCCSNGHDFETEEDYYWNWVRESRELSGRKLSLDYLSEMMYELIEIEESINGKYEVVNNKVEFNIILKNLDKITNYTEWKGKDKSGKDIYDNVINVLVKGLKYDSSYKSFFWSVLSWTLGSCFEETKKHSLEELNTYNGKKRNISELVFYFKENKDNIDNE